MKILFIIQILFLIIGISTLPQFANWTYIQGGFWTSIFCLDWLLLLMALCFLPYIYVKMGENKST